MSELDEFRKQKDTYFYRSPSSPLRFDQKAAFDGLKYYPENPDLRLTLLLDRDVPHDVIMMDTSTGSKQEYRREGVVTFSVDGQDVTLALYATQSPGELFVPFRDATSAKETYGGGRYLETQLNADGTVLLDLNYAYNPYCAYNGDWSSPIPPAENWLPVAIKAGEMLYSSEGH